MVLVAITPSILLDSNDRAIPIIGVGGIDSPETAKARLDAGASLVQVYSAFIYQGPDLVKRIVKAL